MKKIANLALIVTLPLMSQAQNITNTIDKEVFNVCATIVTVGLFMIFIVAIIRRVMEFRIKSKILEKGAAENIVSSIIQSNPKENRNSNVKWFALLTGLGAGLTIINYTEPIGIHSLAIMSFCMAAAFLGYYFFLQRTEK